MSQQTHTTWLSSLGALGGCLGCLHLARCRGGRVALVAMLAICSMMLSSPAFAQQYKTIQPRITEKASKVLRPRVAAALRNPGDLAANQQAIDDYFKKYYFPTMTSTSSHGLGQLEKMREDLFKRFLHGAASKPAQDYITNLTLKVMKVIAMDNYHPAVRYNAVLILGQLDKEYTARGANPRPPVPLPEGTSALLAIMENDEMRGVKIPTMLKVGALVGLERHGRFGIDPKYAQRTTQAAIAVIQQKETPAEISTDVHHWLKCQAGRVLARQFAAGPSAAVHDALVGMIADKSMSLADRCCVAALLKEMNYAAANGLNTTAAVTALGGLAKDVLGDEAEHARDYKKEILGGDAGNFRRGGFNRRANLGGDEGPSYERSRLLDRLLSITHGIEAVMAAASPEQKQQLQKLMGPMRPVIATAGAKDSIDEDIVDAVVQLAKEVDQVVGSWKTAAPAGDEFS